MGKSLWTKRVIGWCAFGVFATSWALVAQGGIESSLHDFSSAGWSGGRICEVCHTAMNGITTVTDAPLWNHEITQATYTLYSSPTLDATTVQPRANSKLCLSCHDGTVALDSFGGATGTNFITGRTHLGTDLRGMHPISFTYNSTLAVSDGSLRDPTSTSSGLGSTIAGDLLFDGKMECASCHDVHNKAGNNKLLRKTDVGSALCLTCHDK